jgi:tetratricopeptide (TPR) repeat protein
MNVKRNIVVFMAAFLFIFSHSLFVSADICDDVVEQAKQIFNQASTASKQKDYAEAVRLYEEAEKYYQKASEMKNCRCPKIEGSARENVNICRKNAAINRKNLDNQVKYEAAEKVVEIYNQASMKFNQGNSYARSQQWKKAMNAFEEAEEIWNSIASTETENGIQAMQSAEKSRDLAKLARQRLEGK